MPPKGACLFAKERSLQGERLFLWEEAMLGEIIAQCRAVQPLLHCITNYVTANDCANLLLACGGSPIMADDPDEAAEITAMCSGLVLNLGTPNPRKIRAMLLAGREANRLGRPVVLDPVGVGCSEMRRDAGRQLLAQVRFAAIRGNAGEIAALTGGAALHRGVDNDAEHAPAASARENAMHLARESGAVVTVTGDTDIVTDGRAVYRVHNGHPMMRTVTGTGCQLSALTGAYVAASPDRPLAAALAAVCAMGLCGEIAHARLSPGEGNASYRGYIIDAIYNLTPENLERGARYEAEQ